MCSDGTTSSNFLEEKEKFRTKWSKKYLDEDIFLKYDGASVHNGFHINEYVDTTQFKNE